MITKTDGGIRMNNASHNSFDIPLPALPDHAAVISNVEALCQRYPFIGYNYLGNSILGRGIPLLSIGTGQRSFLYVASHHGMEWITSLILLRFVWELCDAYTNDRSPHGVNVGLLLDQSTLHVVPMLNPDGVEYQLHGVTEENPLYERVLRMNGGSHDFARWQSNARGVDLNHNYDAGFEEYKHIETQSGIADGAPTRFSGPYPMSEPEVAALCGFIRFQEDLRGVLTLHTQGREIYFEGRGNPPKSAYRAAKKLSALCGYKLAHTEGTASYGGLTDWCVEKLGLPAFTLECGKGENPLPVSLLSTLYCEVRAALFRFPLLL